jgi:hypothetical protein
MVIYSFYVNFWFNDFLNKRNLVMGNELLATGSWPLVTWLLKSDSSQVCKARRQEQVARS